MNSTVDLRKQLQAYFRLHEQDPVAHPLTQEAACDYLGYTSRQSLKNHGLDVLIREKKVQLRAGRNGGKGRTKRRSELEQKYERARDLAAKWELRYHEVLKRLRLIEFHLQKSVDLDAIYNSEMIPPDRSEPQKPRVGARNGRRRNGR